VSRFDLSPPSRASFTSSYLCAHSRTVFATAVDCLGKPGGLEEIIKQLNEMAKSHKRRGIAKKPFVELREIIIEVLSSVCHLDDEGKDAWNCLLDTVYHVIFSNLDDSRMF
jgi:hypothetical protein